MPALPPLPAIPEPGGAVAAAALPGTPPLPVSLMYSARPAAASWAMSAGWHCHWLRLSLAQPWPAGQDVPGQAASTHALWSAQRPPVPPHWFHGRTSLSAAGATGSRGFQGPHPASPSGPPAPRSDSTRQPSRRRQGQCTTGWPSRRNRQPPPQQHPPPKADRLAVVSREVPDAGAAPPALDSCAASGLHCQYPWLRRSQA